MGKRLIDANELINKSTWQGHYIRPLVTGYHCCVRVSDIENTPTVDAVEVSDKRIEKVIRLIESEYERALKLEYVRNPLAFALYRVWKKVDRERRSDER